MQAQASTNVCAYSYKDCIYLQMVKKGQQVSRFHPGETCGLWKAEVGACTAWALPQHLRDWNPTWPWFLSSGLHHCPWVSRAVGLQRAQGHLEWPFLSQDVCLQHALHGFLKNLEARQRHEWGWCKATLTPNSCMTPLSLLPSNRVSLNLSSVKDVKFIFILFSSRHDIKKSNHWTHPILLMISLHVIYKYKQFDSYQVQIKTNCII